MRNEMAETSSRLALWIETFNMLWSNSSLVVINAGVNAGEGLGKLTDFFRYHALEVCSNVCCLYYNA